MYYQTFTICSIGCYVKIMKKRTKEGNVLSEINSVPEQVKGRERVRLKPIYNVMYIKQTHQPLLKLLLPLPLVSFPLYSSE